MAVNTAAILAKWQRNSQAATEDMKRGAQSVTESPTVKAARSVDKMVRNLQDSVQSGRYAAACNKVSVTDWQNAYINKGLRNFTNGVANISPSAQKAMADQQQYADQVKQELASMPTDTEAQADAKMLAAVNKMRAYGKRVQ